MGDHLRTPGILSNLCHIIIVVEILKSDKVVSFHVLLFVLFWDWFCFGGFFVCLLWLGVFFCFVFCLFLFYFLFFANVKKILRKVILGLGML